MQQLKQKKIPVRRCVGCNAQRPYFDSDLRVTWQQIGTEEAGNFERQDDVASVAYWYQLEPHTPFDPIGDRHFRQPR